MDDSTYNVDSVKEHFENRYAASKAENKQSFFNLLCTAVVWAHTVSSLVSSPMGPLS
jgi:hypothetical protein